jgi:Flp pilus assembly protein TadB
MEQYTEWLDGQVEAVREKVDHTTKKGLTILAKSLKSLVPPARIELAAHGLGICLSRFYGFLSCYLMLFLSLYYQCVIRLLIAFCFIVFYPVFGYYGSKMVATK